MKLGDVMVGDGFATRLTGRYGTVMAHVAPEGVRVWWVDKKTEQVLHRDVQVEDCSLLGVPCPEETVA